MGEVLVGPFDNRQEAKLMALKFNKLLDMPIWVIKVFSDVL